MSPALPPRAKPHQIVELMLCSKLSHHDSMKQTHAAHQPNANNPPSAERHGAYTFYLSRGRLLLASCTVYPIHLASGGSWEGQERGADMWGGLSADGLGRLAEPLPLGSGDHDSVSSRDWIGRRRASGNDNALLQVLHGVSPGYMWVAIAGKSSEWWRGRARLRSPRQCRTRADYDQQVPHDFTTLPARLCCIALTGR